jgi:predicted protein tyrosine phosphatase
MIDVDIRVMSREEAKRFSYSVQQNCAIISISGVYAEDNKFAKNPFIKGILRLRFDDVEVASVDYTPISITDAEAIVAFVEKVKDKIDMLVVHCYAGVSRSAGVAAALMAYYNGDDMPIFQNGKYSPNMLCYRTMLKALQINISEDEIIKKKKINVEAWCKVQGFA